MAGFVAWGMTAPGPMPEAEAALRSDAQVTVETGRWMVFRPAGAEPTTGFVFYPGGRVQPRSYAPAARAIAAQGYLVVLVPMPLNLAVLAPDAAAEVIAAYPAVRRLGGGRALPGRRHGRPLRLHPSRRGARVWCSGQPTRPPTTAWPPAALAVVSISGTRDGLSTPAKIEASRPLLPAGTRWVAIEGGNHAQFGWYGPQDGDNPAAISREAQQEQAVRATVELLEKLR